MRKLLIPLVLLAFASSACASFFRTAAAVVNGTPITLDTLDSRVEATLKQNPTFDPSTPGAMARVQRSVLAELIRRQLLREEAAARGLKVTDDDVAKRYDELKQQFPNLEEQIAQAGVTKEQVNDDIRDQIVIERLTQSTSPVTDAQIQATYKKNIDSYRAVKAKHILISNESRSDAEALKRARDARARIEGGESFADVAKALSDDPGSKGKGGELGDPIPLSQLDGGFAKAAWAAKIGALVGPVKSSFGYHLIVTQQKRTEPLAAVAAAIRSELQQQASEKVVQEVSDRRIAKAKIVVNPRFGDWDPKTEQIVEHDFFEPPTADVNRPSSAPVVGVPGP